MSRMALCLDPAGASLGARDSALGAAALLVPLDSRHEPERGDSVLAQLHDVRSVFSNMASEATARHVQLGLVGDVDDRRSRTPFAIHFLMSLYVVPVSHHIQGR
jgi:hypothetical protein